MARRFPLLIPALLAIASIASDAGPAAQHYYADASQVCLQQILAPPPPPDSAASKADLAAVLEVQRTRTQAEVRSAQADEELSVFRFADAIGPGFKSENLSFTHLVFLSTRLIG
jgi:acid phosphatase (class A)